MRSKTTRALACLALALLTAACGGASRRAAKDAAARAAADTVPRAYAASDVRFMHQMLAHHGEALAMMTLVRTQAARADVRVLALRMELSQRDELALMRYWLENRGEAVVAVVPGRDGEPALPGMLAEAQRDSLRAAKGPAFDELFLRYMIQHDEGALAMVLAHLRTPGAARQAETHRFLSDIEAERRAELHRLRTLLAALGQ